MRIWSNVEKPIRHFSDGITIVITLLKSLNLPENEFSFFEQQTKFDLRKVIILTPS